MFKAASINESVNSGIKNSSEKKSVLKKLMNNLMKELIIGGPINFPNKYGNFNLFYFKEKKTGKCHVALVNMPLKNKSVNKKISVEKSENEMPIVRIHSECLTGDALCSLRCDCNKQLNESLKKISRSSGVLIYLRQEGRGIGLFSKLRAYKLQDEGLDTVQANIKLGFDSDMRNYSIAAAILNYFSIDKIKLLTNNPDKINSLEKYGIKIVERIPIKVGFNKFNENYLKIKKDKLGHLL